MIFIDSDKFERIEKLAVSNKEACDKVATTVKTKKDAIKKSLLDKAKK
jgi:hypothetical protein